MEGVTPRATRWLLVIGVVYAAVVIPIGVHKGGDVVAELSQSERLLGGVPLYQEPPGKGMWWPPFTALGLVPLALVARWSVAVAKALWAALNVACLGWSLALARRWTTGWAPVALAIAAVGKPLQSNFEHLNITPILLVLAMAAAADLRAGRETRAGAWLGLATAVKAFPALALLYFLMTRRWRGLLAGGAVAAGLTLGAMLPYGPAGALSAVLAWGSLSGHAAPFGALGTQSLAGFGALFGWSPWVIGALAAACLVATAAALYRSAAAPLAGIAAASLLAVLCSPIAWLYYHTLAFPGWLAALTQGPPGTPRRRAALGAAALLTSGVLTFGLYPRWLRVVGAANYTWGSLLLLATLLFDLLRQPPPVPRSS